MTCQGCNEPIHLLDDPTEGRRPISFGGDGMISTVCRRCLTHALYPASTMVSIQAVSALEATHPKRVKVSSSSRKPISLTYPKAQAIFGVGYVEDRPLAAAIIARIITSWPDVEVQCTRLLGVLMGTNVIAAAAVFGSLRSSRAQIEALSAAAKAVLSKTDFELFSAHMLRRASLEKERNDLAHGCFGVSPAIPDTIIWASQTDYLTFTASVKHDPEAGERFRKAQAVYELGTLERIAQEIEEFHLQLGSFTGYLRALEDGARGTEFRAKRYTELCSQSHIRQALDRVRIEKNGKKSRVPKQPSPKRGKKEDLNK